VKTPLIALIVLTFAVVPVMVDPERVAKLAVVPVTVVPVIVVNPAVSPCDN